MSLVGSSKIEVELVLVFLFNELHAELPFRKIAVLDRFPQIAAMKIRILAGDLLGFVPHDGVNAEQAASNETSRSATCPYR